MNWNDSVICGGPVESQLKSWPWNRTFATPGRCGEKRKIEEKSLLTEKCGPNDIAQANALRGEPASPRCRPAFHPAGTPFPPDAIIRRTGLPRTLVFRPAALDAKTCAKFCPYTCVPRVHLHWRLKSKRCLPSGAVFRLCSYAWGRMFRRVAVLESVWEPFVQKAVVSKS